MGKNEPCGVNKRQHTKMYAVLFFIFYSSLFLQVQEALPSLRGLYEEGREPYVKEDCQENLHKDE